MNIVKLAAAAAIALSSLSLPAMPAAAQGNHRGEYRHDGARHDAGRDDNRRAGRDDNRRWRGDRGRHRGWRNQRRTRVCRTVWRHHQRQRVCWWRYHNRRR